MSFSLSQEDKENSTDKSPIMRMFSEMSGTVIDTENKTSAEVLVTTRHALFSGQSTIEALEESLEESQTESTFMMKTSNTSEVAGDLHDNLVWNLIENGEMDLGLLAASLGILLAVIVMVSLYFMMRSKRLYRRIPGTCEGRDYEYIYKPLAGNAIDEDYENTFVGVSIPLIQDVTKL